MQKYQQEKAQWKQSFLWARQGPTVLFTPLSRGICWCPSTSVCLIAVEGQKVKVKVKSLSCVWLFATQWTVAYQTPPSMGFSRQEYWSGLPFPSPRRSETHPKSTAERQGRGEYECYVLGWLNSMSYEKSMKHWIFKCICMFSDWRRKWQPTPVFLPGESHGWRSLIGYSPLGHKESDTTEQLRHSEAHLGSPKWLSFINGKWV